MTIAEKAQVVEFATEAKNAKEKLARLALIAERFLSWAQALPETVIPAGLEDDMREAIEKAK